jgi:Beta-propeller repeat
MFIHRRVVVSKVSASAKWVSASCFAAMLAAISLVPVFVTHNKRDIGASPSPAAAQPPTIAPILQGKIRAAYASLPLAFEKNNGQTDKAAKVMARANGYTLFLTQDEAVFSLHSRCGFNHSTVSRPNAFGSSGAHSGAAQNENRESGAVVHMQLLGAKSLGKISASEELPGKANYFIGDDPSKWREDIPLYARVSYQNVYPGVNLAFHGEQRELEFDFVVAPGASPGQIGLRFKGAKRLKTDESGNLVISSDAGDVLLHKPLAYQQQNHARQPVDAHFVLGANNRVTFELGNYDRSRELVIDPSVTISYATYLGGTGEDDGYGISVDGSENVYVTGQTYSTNFPTLGGIAPNSNVGGSDVFVTKIASGGSALVYSTYIGGSGNDSGNAIAINSSGEAFVAGGTASSNFPTTLGAFQTTLGSGATSNAFVLELNSNGNALIYSTFLGGTAEDFALGVAVDNSGSAYVAGEASSSDFPVQSPIQGYISGTKSSGFVTKLNTSGSALTYSTYLGGSSSGDLAGAVAVDSAHNAYITGQTFSTTFPTKNPFQPACGSCSGGLSNAFVTVINTAGTGYVYSTYLGGSGGDAGNGIAVDSSDNAYVTGATESTNFPLQSPIQKTYGGDTDAFVSKLNSTGSALVYSTYLGGAQFDAAAAIAVDGSGNAYLTGQTYSTSFPTMSPTQSALDGLSDAFVTEINAAGSSLVFSTYLGGSQDEDTSERGAIAIDSQGANFYLTGNTDSSDFPTSKGAFQTGYAGDTDAFVVQYSQPVSQTFSLSATNLTPPSVSPGGSSTSTVSVSSPNGFSGSVALTCTVSPSVALAPTCGAASASTTPAALTVSTTAPSAALGRPNSWPIYAFVFPLAGIWLLGMGATPRQRRENFFVLLTIAGMAAALIFLPACGGSSSGGGSSSAGTPAGTYTITVTGTATGATQTGTSPALTLVVN